jgi:kynurenine formamidase
MDRRCCHVWLEEGEFLIVPRGVEHRPVAEEEVHVLLVEPATTLNTGEARNERTVEDSQQFGGEAMLIDLSHTVEHGMITYKGLPAPVVCDYLSRQASRKLYAPGTEFHIGKIEMVANTGTYLDSPFHRYAEGKDLSQLPLERLADLEAVVVRWDRHGRAIGVSALEGRPVRGKAVLIETGWSAHWRTDRYFEGHPFLTRDAAEYLRRAWATLIGIDSYNIDDTDDPFHALGGRDPDRGAPDGAGADARGGGPVLRRAGEGRGDADLPGAGVRRR